MRIVRAMTPQHAEDNPGVIGPSPSQLTTVTAVGALRWIELHVFRLAGVWSSSADAPAVAVELAVVSRHAADRARVLADRLPREGHLRLEVVTVPPSAEVAEGVEALMSVDGDLDRVAILADAVLGPLSDAVGALTDELSPVADAPLLRVLPGLGIDLDADRQRLVDVATGVLDSGPGDGRWDRAAGALNGLSLAATALLKA